MKYCEDYAALLDAYVDGECTPEEAEKVRRHLESCSGCRAYVELARCLHASFPGPEDGAFPVGFAQGVMAAVRADSAPRRRRTPWKRVLASAAACLVIALAAWRVPMNFRAQSAAPASAAAAAADSAAAGASAPSENSAAEEKSAAGENAAAEAPAAPETESGAWSGGTAPAQTFSAPAVQDRAAQTAPKSGSAAQSASPGAAADTAQPAAGPTTSAAVAPPQTSASGGGTDSDDSSAGAAETGAAGDSGSSDDSASDSGASDDSASSAGAETADGGGSSADADASNNASDNASNSNELPSFGIQQEPGLDSLLVTNTPDTALTAAEAAQSCYKSALCDGITFDRWELLTPYTGVWTRVEGTGALELRFAMTEPQFDAFVQACGAESSAVVNSGADRSSCCVALTHLG
jgi:hypothetical protein